MHRAQSTVDIPGFAGSPSDIAPGVGGPPEGVSAAEQAPRQASAIAVDSRADCDALCSAVRLGKFNPPRSEADSALGFAICLRSLKSAQSTSDRSRWMIADCKAYVSLHFPMYPSILRVFRFYTLHFPFVFCVDFFKVNSRAQCTAESRISKTNT